MIICLLGKVDIFFLLGKFYLPKEHCNLLEYTGVILLLKSDKNFLFIYGPSSHWKEEFRFFFDNDGGYEKFVGY